MRSLDQVRANYSILALKGEMTHFLAHASAKWTAEIVTIFSQVSWAKYFNIQKHTSTLSPSDSNMYLGLA